MLEIQYEQFGPPPVVAKCVKGEDPGEPSVWDVIVEVDACAVNPSDLAMLYGQYGKLNKPPAKIGMEAGGIVVAVGASVTRVAVGDRVMILANDNWAQKRKVPEALVVKVPSDFDPMQVAMMKVNAATALLMIRTQKLSKNDWVIQNAPLSTVGRAVIQIAKSLDIKTINIVRRPDAIEEVKALGGDVVLEDGENLAAQVREALGRKKLKLGLDAVAGTGTLAIANCLDKGAKLINYGILSSQPCQIAADHLMFNAIELQGFWLSKYLNRISANERDELYAEIIELMRDGKVSGLVDSCYKLSDIQDALKRAQTPGRVGKVILLPNGEL